MEKRYNHQEQEKKAQELWEQEQTYAFDESSQENVFSIDTPPPTVSGNLHIGHIFSYTHTDIIARFKRMQGFNVYYPMGYDDNGLPTERYVEKKHKTKAHLMKRSEFIDLCLQETEIVEKEFEKLWKSMGLSIDWRHTYSTISDSVRKISQYSFVDLFKKNLVYRKQEPSLYCTTCRTSVAQAELDDLEQASTFNDITFSTEQGEKLTVATTRPELLPACVAVFHHPEDKRYKHLTGTQAITPVFNKKVPILADDKVDPEKGTGLVMCCTFGDQTDIYWFKTHNLPFVQVVGFDGKWTADAGELEGLRVHEARKRILELLQESGGLIEQKKISHPVNVHERCKQEIEYLVLNQWFVKILDHKKDFLDQAEKIEWVPSFMQARYKDWVENLAWDWCISRQRFYGIPFPLWHCASCNHVILADEKDLPIDPQETPYPGGSCPECKGTDLRPETDVMDTWNTSSLTPQINNDWPHQKQGLGMPMTMRPQAHDIIRTWAFYTIIKAHYHNQTIPWNQIVISGHVLAGKEKLSKSKNNSPLAPENLLERHSADAIRYWTAQGKPGMDIAFSENQLKIGSRLVTKLWNAFRFCKEHMTGTQAQIDLKDLDPLNKWLAHQLSDTIERYIKHFEKFEYHIALEVAEKFFWQHFCDNYLELVKDQFFNPEKYSEKQIEETRFMLQHAGLAILKLFAPITPYITETLYQELFRKDAGTNSLHTTRLKAEDYTFSDTQAVETVEKLITAVGYVRKLKSENKLSLGSEVAQLILDKNAQSALEPLSRIIAGVCKAQSIEFSEVSETALVVDDEKVIITISEAN